MAELLSTHRAGRGGQETPGAHRDKCVIMASSSGHGDSSLAHGCAVAISPPCSSCPHTEP